MKTTGVSISKLSKKQVDKGDSDKKKKKNGEKRYTYLCQMVKLEPCLFCGFILSYHNTLVHLQRI